MAVTRYNPSPGMLESSDTPQRSSFSLRKSSGSKNKALKYNSYDGLWPSKVIHIKKQNFQVAGAYYVATSITFDYATYFFSLENDGHLKSSNSVTLHF